MTGNILILWAVWGVFVLLVLALKVYSDRLSRDEDDQLVLDEAFAHVKNQQAAMMEKVHRIEPVRNVALGLLGIMTLVILGYYAVDIINQFK
ncbi:MAG: hypothetical protein ABSG51_01190 [Terracidiphilus sp.]|jgi:hypothetical protein